MHHDAPSQQPVTPPVRGVVFDFDGTLVDSESLHALALRSVLSTRGLEGWFDPGMAVGLPDRDVICSILERAGQRVDEDELSTLLEFKSKAARRLWDAGEGRAYEGAVELLHAVKLRGAKVAVCTAAMRREAAPVLERLGVLGGLDAFVTADDVAVSKPDPECYRLVCAAMGLPAEACVALEDSEAGVSAAAGAGLRVAALGHTTARTKLRGLTWYFERITQVDAGWLIGGA